MFLQVAKYICPSFMNYYLKEGERGESFDMWHQLTWKIAKLQSMQAVFRTEKPKQSLTLN